MLILTNKLTIVKEVRRLGNLRKLGNEKEISKLGGGTS